MAVSMRDLDPAFQGAGQKAGIEIWRIENFRPVPVPKLSYGKFFTGDSYVILKTTGSKSGALRHDIHYWLGKDTTQDEAGAAAVKTVELDAALGGRAVQYREVQGHETEKFLSYFKPCIIPQEGGVTSGFKHVHEEHKARLFVCRGKHVVHVKEVPFARSSLNHDDIFILDTKSKIFQFNGSNSSIQERAKALEVVQYIKDTYHDGKCEVAAIEDGRLMADAETGEFWGFFGGFAPLPRKTTTDEDKTVDSHPTKLLSVEKGQAEPVEADSLTRVLLNTNKCYILDCGLEVFVWMGRNTSLDERKSASRALEELIRGSDQLKSHIIRVIEGFETVIFRSKFDSWPQATNVAVTEDGRGKVAVLLQRQGVNVKGLLKTAPVKEEPQPYIDCTGNLQVASSLSSSYCYILHSGSTVFTWAGKLTSPDDQELVERQLDLIKPNLQSKPQKEGSESEQFWELLGGKSEYPSQKISREPEGDPHLFSCTFSKGNLKVMEIYNFTQDDLMTEDIFILDCHSDIFVWVGQQVDTKNKLLALTIGEKFLEQDFLLENLSRETPIYIAMEGSEPPFFTRFFTWDFAKSTMHGNSFQRKLTIVKNGGTPIIDKPKRRTPVSYGGRSSVPDKSQRSRSMSFSPDRVRVRGRSPAFNALAATFENPNARNLSTPPPMVRKIYPKSVTPDSATKSAAIAALSATFERPSARETIIPRSVKVSPPAPKSTPELKENSMSSRLESLTIQEDVKEGEAEDEEGLPIYPYERLKITSTDPVSEIDVTKRETYVSSEEFKEKFGMKKDAFYKLPKWKQNKLKMALQLF
ncbi:villin-4-like isoform X4 [Durio zibethinus]|uniref:Villin-4-like isoform X4 n=1 Tax=Durio zibethinus TaxID=66656 RepID=A0A6P5ZRE3_DURZI|nr:villin-4-like isoform X4 [Durio zibethinus]